MTKDNVFFDYWLSSTSPAPSRREVVTVDELGSLGRRLEPGAAGRHRSFCRCCINRCALLVDVDAGRVVKVTGDPEDPLYGGYTCVKGRNQAAYLYHDDRLLRSLHRDSAGDLVAVDVEEAIDEISDRLYGIWKAHGPHAIAGYWGTMATGVLGGQNTFFSVMELLGSDLVFDPRTIDKGGKQIAAQALGQWLAPGQGFDRPEVALMIGVNPLITYTGFPAGSPSRWLGDQQRRGMKLIVIDPRRTELAERADLYLQAKPGHDPALLAAMINVILSEDRFDAHFVAHHVAGLDVLRTAVAKFDPTNVAISAGIRPEHLVEAARIFSGAGRGFAFGGTGPNMAGNGSLAEYLILVLETICGHWLRAGDTVVAAPTLVAAPEYRAEAVTPTVTWGRPLRVRSLRASAAGMPTAALADEILLEGEGQIRALLSWSGNPVVAFPDQEKTIQALKSLDLYVQLDPFLTPSAQLADFVIAPTMPLEAASSTLHMDTSGMKATGYGSRLSYANVTAAVVEPPPNSELIDEWRFFKGLYLRLHRRMSADGVAVPPVPDHIRADTDEEVLSSITRGSRVPWETVAARGHGALYPSPECVVQEGTPGSRGRLDVGNEGLLHDLASVSVVDASPRSSEDDRFPFRLLCRRLNHTYNTSHNVPATNRGTSHNHAYLNPADARALGAAVGDLIEVRSAIAAIPAVLAEDPHCRQGTISMAFGFGAGPERDGEVRTIGSSPSRLVSASDVFDPYTGQPRMSNVPVAVRLLSRASTRLSAQTPKTASVVPKL